MSNLIKNGKVVYVEPNISSDFTSYKSDNMGTVFKSVDLEDMCIVVGLEVEVKGRTYMSSYNGNQNNIQLTWQSSTNGEKVSFMEGTKIPTSDGGFVRSLTTNYTDCHLYDVENDGTAEMFGIKSIDISYNNFMVPEVTIQFVDVRGVSLFAQEEMRHNLTDKNGMGGYVNNSIEGSFFKCFFTFPYPKFTLKVKGFYGEMVSYELMCSDFRAAFDSNTGNFNVTAKFVGYAFSFLGDVMVNGLVSAPYSEYIGKAYWEKNIENNRFVLENGIPMKKIGEICMSYREIEQRVAETIKEKGMVNIIKEYGGTEEEEQITKDVGLLELRTVYSELTGKLQDIAKGLNINICHQKTGDIAINPEGTKSYAFITNDEVKSLDELISEFDGFYKKLNQVGSTSGNDGLLKWISGRKNYIALIKYDAYGDIIDEASNIKEDKVSEDSLRNEIERISREKPINSEWNSYYEAWVDEVWVGEAFFNRKDSYVYIYQDFGLSDILSGNANASYDSEREQSSIYKKYEQLLLNKEFKEVFKFEPTVENITKIIMAHVETFVHMISQCAVNIIGSGTKRTVENMGIKDYESFPDIAPNNSIGATKDTIVAPFPKVTRDKTENGATKTEGHWIGDLLDQDKAEEIKLIEGILNGIADVSYEINKATGASGIAETKPGPGAIKYPITYFDMFLERQDKPFGDITLSDVNNVFASMCVRAFSVMATQGENDVDAFTYGIIDADNFIEIYKNNSDIKTLASVIKTVTSEKVIKFLTSENDRIDESKKSNPWGKKITTLLTNTGKGFRLNAGYLGKNSAIFPTKNWNFNQILQYAVKNDSNPSSGLKDRSIDNYIITPIGDDGSSSHIIEIKESPILYFQNEYSKLSNSVYEKENKAASGIFKTSDGFKFDYDKWAEKYGTWSPFLNNDGESVKYKNAITYDKDGNVSSTNNCALDFKNIFMDEEFLQKGEYGRGIAFIDRVFADEKTRIGDRYTAELPKVTYLGKFSVLKNGTDFIKAASTATIRKKIVRNIKKYLTDWIEKEYRKIEAIYILQYADGRDKNTLLGDISRSDGTDNGIMLAFKQNLKEGYWNTFFNVYSVSLDINGGIYLKTRPCNEMSSIIRDLMKIVGVCTLSKFNTTSEEYDITLSKSSIEGYFNGFIKGLQDNLVGYGDIQTKEANIISNTDPDDVKVGVYNYIKMLYDKWIASDPEDKFYTIESLFNGNDPTFHFIDSAYNRIGNTMYLNLSTLIDRVVQSQTQNGYTLLSMLSGLYADNKFMFLCIQNFLDFAREDMMDKMFRPISYLDKNEPNNHPNFVVLMPYEPSSKLDVEGADYPNDSFYLNDERTWPKMISTKPDDSLPIPAFGVTYGQQYQNYFKNIQVDMNSPMVTEQSIKAKFMVAGVNTGDENNGPKPTTIGQDLYTIYSNNSYTCTVTMMGCAWVQPMMYFVLQNVPMFRGSYMIVKVNHQIQPGNMITTFKGVRMANTATRSVENPIYINVNDSVPRAGNELSSTGNVNGVVNYADIANDCSYAYYSPIGEVVSVPSDSDAQAYCYATYQSLVKSGLTEEQAKGICANIKQESGFNPYVVTIDGNSSTHGVSGGLCGFYYHGKAPELFEYAYPDEDWMAKLDELNAKVEPYWRDKDPCSPTYTEKIANAGIKYTVSFEKQVAYLCKMVNTSYTGIKSQKTETDSANWWMREYEKPSKESDRWKNNGGWVNSAIENEKKIAKTDTNNTENQNKSLDEIAEGLKDSLQSSMRASQYYRQTEVTMEKNNIWYYDYKTNDPKSMNALFDCMLSSYGQWFDKIRWCVRNTHGKHDAIGVRVHLTNTPPSSHDITILGSDTNGETILLLAGKDDINESLRKILIKYFKSKNITAPEQAKSVFKSCTRLDNNVVTELFEFSETKSVKSCSSVFGKTANVSNSVLTKAVLAEYFPNGVVTEDTIGGFIETFTLPTGQKVTMHKKVKDELIAAFNEIKNDTTYNVTSVGGYKWRKVNNGTDSDTLSKHSYGLAIDINDGPRGNPFFNTKNIAENESNIPNPLWGFRMGGGSPISAYHGEYDNTKCIWYKNHPVVQIMQKHGFGWGGRYGDTMHFSVFNGE